MSRRSDAREQAIATAERLFRTQGYAATGLTQILEESGAPKGSFYFHFPGGKDEMAMAALMRYGGRVRDALAALATHHGDDEVGFVRSLCQRTADDMRRSDWRLGCLAQNLAHEHAPTDQLMASALADVFESWTGVVASVFAKHRPAAAAAVAASALLAGLEGARTLCRAHRNDSAFEAVAAATVAALRPKT
jgi:AcrR family transcriptional regulator